MDRQQVFIVAVSSSGRPVERSRDHHFVIEHGELVVQFVTACKAGGADSLERLIQRLITLFDLPRVIWKGDTQ